jgi:hypothetical protein
MDTQSRFPLSSLSKAQFSLELKVRKHDWSRRSMVADDITSLMSVSLIMEKEKIKECMVFNFEKNCSEQFSHSDFFRLKYSIVEIVEELKLRKVPNPFFFFLTHSLTHCVVQFCSFFS